MPKFLVIDDSRSFRNYFKKAIAHRWPHADIETYDPHRRGKPDDDFSWSDYDMIFLDYDLGFQTENGLDWLKMIKARQSSASVVIVTGEGDEKVAVKAIKLGADSYLIKYDLASELLYERVTDILTHRAMLESLQQQRKDEEELQLGENETELIDITGYGVKKYVNRWHIPGYFCIREIASGSWSTTLLAEREKDQQQVVLKVLDVRDVTQPVLVKRFMREFTILSNLHHPNIIKTMDYGFTEEYAYYSMEYLSNGDLAGKIKRDHLLPESAVNYTLSLARGLSALHELNVVHRDVKPNNILFKEDDDLVIADLGIAKDLTCQEVMTARGEVLGTPFYMSPEQIKGAQIDRRTDIYSLGILFYELLTGRKPFSGDSIIEVACQHAYDKPPPLPTELATFQPLVEKLLEKSPTDRYQNIPEFIAALAAVSQN